MSLHRVSSFCPSSSLISQRRSLAAFFALFLIDFQAAVAKQSILCKRDEFDVIILVH